MSRILLLCLLGTVSPGLLVASYDCAQAANEVEKAVCADPQVSALDGAMSKAFADAKSRAGADGAVLLQDQRNWVAERDDLVRALQPDFSRELKRDYQERIDFLRRIHAQASDSALIGAIQQALPSLPASSDSQHVEAVVPQLAKSRGLLTLADEASFDPAQSWPRLSVKPLPALLDALKQMDERQWIDYLPAMSFGGIYDVEGSAGCVGWALFDVRDRVARPVEVPATLQGNCEGSNSMLAEYGRQLYAVREAVSLAAADIVVQPRTANGWGEQSRLLARYDHELAAKQGFCGQADCADARALALRYATRYDRQPLPATLAGHLSAADAQRYQEMLRRAQAGRLPEILASLPQPAASPSTALSDFSKEASWFPLSFRGELLLGRIGHGHLGWRDSDDWLVGFWRLKGASFEPVAGVVVTRRRGKFLIAAPMPARSIDNAAH